MITIIGNDPQAWGYLPDFLHERDPRPAAEQLNDRAPGGWLSMKPHGMTFSPETMVMAFPGDPPFQPISALHFRDELLLLYEHSFVVILQRDGHGTWDAAGWTRACGISCGLGV